MPALSLSKCRNARISESFRQSRILAVAIARTPRLIERDHSHKKHKMHRTHGAVPNGVSSETLAQVANYWQYEHLPASPFACSTPQFCAMLARNFVLASSLVARLSAQWSLKAAMQ